jgi:Na+-driven multidrug efflux pump
MPLLTYLQESTEAHPAPETETLGVLPPLRLLLTSSAGPFLAELASGTFALVDSFWIGRTCGETGLASVSLASLFDYIGRAFGALMVVASSSQFAKLRGEKKYDALPQLFADLFRLCIVIGVICPCIIGPIVKPVLRFFDAEGEVLDGGFRYVLPLCCGSVVTCLNMMFCGLLQSEGRSFAYGAVQVTNFVLNMAVYDPLFLIVFKSGLLGAGLATVCSEATPMIVVATCFFLKKFDTHPRAANFCRWFGRDSLEAVKTGLTQFITHLSWVLPTFVTRKFVTVDADAMDCYVECLAAYNAVFRVWPFAQSYATAIGTAFLPAASYAVGACRPGRVLRLFGWGVLLSTIWCAFTETLLFVFGKYFARIFGDSPGLIDATVKMITGTYACQALNGFSLLTVPLLQATGRVWTAVIIGIATQFAAGPVAGIIIFVTDRSHNIFRFMWMYSIADGAGFAVSLGFVIAIVWSLWQQVKEENKGKTASRFNQNALQQTEPGTDEGRALLCDGDVTYT